MKSLETIQKVSKLGRIISKIVYIFCFIGLVFIIIGALGVTLMPNEFIINSGDFSFIKMPQIKLSKAGIFDALLIGSIGLISEMYIAKKAEQYFKFELEEKTPFTEEGADRIKKLGIIVIVVPIIATCISIIAHAILVSLYDGVGNVDINYEISLTMGLVFLFLSAVFRYGASLEKKGTKKTRKTKKVEESAE